MGREKRRSFWSWIRFVIVFGIVGFVVFCNLFISPVKLIERGTATRAFAEISGIELAITKMLSDGDSTNLRDFFDDAAFSDAVARLGRERAFAPFEASVEIYTHSTYALLRAGRSANLADRNDYAATLRPELLKNLGTSYIPDLALDPWGELYRIFPGPWPEAMGPVVFRNYLPPSPLPADKEIAPNPLLMSGIDDITGEPMTFGVPAPSNQEAYIWSFGANLISGQPKYDPSHLYAPPAQQHYESGQEPELCGGGDDINNWDRDQTFMRFYN